MAETDKLNIAAPLVMNLQSHPSTMAEGQLSYALNAVPEEDTAGKPYLSNIGANEITSVIYPAGYIPIGWERLDGNDKCVFLVNKGEGNSQIGIIHNGKYTVVVQDPRLGFDIRYQIQAKTKTLFNGNRIVNWTDFNMPMRNMNLDNVPYIKTIDANGNIVVTTDLDIDQLKVFKNYSVPELDVIEITNNGQLLSGGYYMSGQYADGRGNGLTAWFKLTPKVPIIRDSISDAYENITGNPSGLITNKAIKLAIRDADLSFTHINIGVIRSIDGSLRSFKVATISIQQTEYTYSGSGTEIAVPLEEMLAPATVYDKAKTVAESDGSLVWGNLTGKQPINFQPYVNQIQVQWQSYRTKARDRFESAKNSIFAAYKQSYRRDEVIPLGIVFQLLDGTESTWHPFIGREINKKANGTPFTRTTDYYGTPIDPAKWDSQVAPASLDVYENLNLPRWKVANTATVEGDKLASGTTEGLSFFGEMAYWESTDRYPNNVDVYGALAGKYIRFPKMPDSSILHIHDGEGTTRGMTDDLYLYHMGIILPNITQVISDMPIEIQAQITGWRIVRADRTFDKSIQASGLLFNAWVQDFRSRSTDEPELRLYPNYGLNDLRPDPYIDKKTNNTTIQDAIGITNGAGGYKNDRYLKNTFTFLSPDTTLNRTPLSNSELKVNAELYGQADCYHSWVDPYPKLKERDGKDSKAALQGTAIGFYNNFKKPQVGQSRRKLDEAIYIPFNAQVSGGNAGLPVWNKGRDSTVLLKTSETIVDPSVQDRSRFILNNTEVGLQEGESFTANQDGEEGGVLSHVKRPTSSYYVSIKRNIPNQYGAINNIKLVDTGYDNRRYAREGIVFGGDSYIGLFAAKRQMPFYSDIQKYMNMGDGGNNINFQATMILPGVHYYYKDTGGNPRNNSKMMLEDNSGWFGGDDKDLGFLTLFMEGVPVFWSEADLNLELRYEGETSAEAFYPSLLNGAISVVDWLGVVNLDKDNSYLHNSDLSGYNNLNYFGHVDPLFEPGNSAISRYFTRAIKSLRSQPEDLYDNWQVYKPLDYYDFPKSKGEIIDIRYIGSSRTLFRLARTAYVTQLMQVIQTSGESVLLGQGRLFAQDPTEPIESQIPYVGTSSQWAFDICEFGAFFIGSRGKVFNLAEGFKEITTNEYNAEEWFEQNLTFILSKQLPGISTDNPYNPDGIGIHSTYDAKHKLWFVTKKDYELRDPGMINRIELDSAGNILLDKKVVHLKDHNVFIDRSFTISFCPKPNNRGWVSFYSFIPDMYIGEEEGFTTVLQIAGTSAIHRHGRTDKYNNFYGKRYPFILEYVTKTDGVSTMVHAHTSFITKGLQFSGRDIIDIALRTFNKAIVYNDHQCTGLLNLVVQDENDLSTLYTQLKVNGSSKDTALRARDRKWNFSDYFDIVKGQGTIFTRDWNNDDYRSQYPIDKVLNNSNLDYQEFLSVGASLRSQYTKTRLILDNTDDLKLLFQIGIESVRNSYS